MCKPHEVAHCRFFSHFNYLKPGPCLNHGLFRWVVRRKPWSDSSPLEFFLSVIADFSKPVGPAHVIDRGRMFRGLVAPTDRVGA